MTTTAKSTTTQWQVSRFILVAKQQRGLIGVLCVCAVCAVCCVLCCAVLCCLWVGGGGGRRGRACRRSNACIVRGKYLRTYVRKYVLRSWDKSDLRSDPKHFLERSEGIWSKCCPRVQKISVCPRVQKYIFGRAAKCQFSFLVYTVHTSSLLYVQSGW